MIAVLPDSCNKVDCCVVPPEMICNDENDELAGQHWTLICHSSVLNLGENSCVAGQSITDVTAKMPKK
jgi:hypothetical protein